MSVGAVLFYLDNFVSARVMRTTYGIAINADFDPNDPEHHARRATNLYRASGRVVVPEAFSIILKKVAIMSSTLRGVRTLTARNTGFNCGRECRDKKPIPL